MGWLSGCNKTTYENGTFEYEYGEGCMEKTHVIVIWGWIVSIFCIGGMMGGSLVGFVSKTFGRKGGLLLNNILVAIATVLLGFAKMAGSFEMLLLGRLVIGINAGLNAGLAPMYLSEIAPISLRGAVSTTRARLIVG